MAIKRRESSLRDQRAFYEMGKRVEEEDRVDIRDGGEG